MQKSYKNFLLENIAKDQRYSNRAVKFATHTQIFQQKTT